MQVYCTDGTVFRCRSFEVAEYGVHLYGTPPDADEERYAGDPEQVGFVPHDRLWYVLPEGVISAAIQPAQPQPAAAPETQPQRPQPPTARNR
ncbi:hypothetical protein [Halorientalis halophila]|uniref:hypothetical protein n=1 Tax=Halorientalis halophila TaxID=3108499 RepID=UPI00300937B0